MQITRRLFCVLLVLVSTVSTAFSQTSTSPKEEKPDYASEPYVIEQLRSSVRYEADGKGQREQILNVRIQSESAVREFGLLVFPFMASFESLDIVYVRVRKPDGSVVVTPPDDFQELDSAVSRQAPMYTDQREKHVAVKSLGVGDTLESQIRWNIHDPVAPGHFWFDYNFFENGICLDEQLEISVPANVPVKLASSGPAPQMKEENSRRTYIFHASHLQKHKDEKDDEKIPDWEKHFHGLDPPAVRMSSFSSWAEVGAWYAGLQQPRVQVTPRIRSTAEEITKGKVTDLEKIHAIYDYVSLRIRYIGINLGAGRYTPHAAEDVLANRYGDCKDKHTLFAALMEAVGLHAYPALISSRLKLDVNTPSASPFDHVITAIPQGSSYIFMDSTPEVAPFGLLTATLRDRQALLMPIGSPALLITTPADPPAAGGERFTMDASIDSDGTLDGKTRIEAHGDSELVLRQAYRNTPQNQWKELTQGIIGRMGFAGEVSEVAVETPEKTAETFWITYDYHRQDYSDWKEHQITLPYPFMFLPELNEAQKKSKDPLPIGSPVEYLYEANLKLPPGILAVLPASVEQKTDFAEFSSTYSLDLVAGALHGTRRLLLKQRELPGIKRGEYVALVKAISDDLQHWMTLTGDFEHASPVSQGRKLLAEGKTAEAIAVLQKASEGKGADRQDIALALGAAYLRLPDESKASVQFQKLLEIEPSAELLSAVASEYIKANVHLKDAVDYASRSVAQTDAEAMKASLDSLTPEDLLRSGALASRWDTLGWAKFRSGDAESAEKYLKSAWMLNQRALIGEHLAEVYEKLGKKREAVRICSFALGSPGLDAEPGTHDKLLEIQKRIGILPQEKQPTALKAPNGRMVQVVPDGLSDMRTIKLPAKVELSGNSKIALFAVAIENGRKGGKGKYISGDKELSPEAEAFDGIDLRQPFPDDTPSKIFRVGWISCSKYTKDCSLVFFFADDKQGAEMLKPN